MLPAKPRSPPLLLRGQNPPPLAPHRHGGQATPSPPLPPRSPSSSSSSAIALARAGSAQEAGERLSAQSSVGLGATKVTKRRSRASSKPPITVLAADAANFRAMVQKLTGVAAPPPPFPRGKYPFCHAPSPPSILNPPPSHAFHGLPTLDTSALLLHTPPHPPPPLLPVAQLAPSSHGFPSLPSVSASELKALFPSFAYGSPPKKPWDSPADAGGLRQAPSQGGFGGKSEASALESFLMGNQNAGSSARRLAHSA